MQRKRERYKQQVANYIRALQVIYKTHQTFELRVIVKLIRILILSTQVNGTNLTDVMDCETAISNLHTCNGKPFVFKVHMTTKADGQYSNSSSIQHQKMYILCPSICFSSKELSSCEQSRRSLLQKFSSLENLQLMR